MVFPTMSGVDDNKSILLAGISISIFLFSSVCYMVTLGQVSQ
jgi:hypothetical protein